MRANRAAPAETVHSYWGMLVIHVAAHKSGERHRAEFDQFRELLLDDVKARVGLSSYEQICPLLRDHGLGELVQDIEARISSATQTSPQRPRARPQNSAGPSRRWA